VITYYRDREVLVTSTGVRMTGRDYRLDDLQQVWHKRGRRDWSKVAGRGALGLAMIIPVVVGALGILILLQTADRQRFGQIYRALQRALDSGTVPR
jgi:hypothetical protein